MVAEDNFDLHRAAERGRRYQAIYRPMFLANVFRVIGVSGTLTSNSLKQLNQHQESSMVTMTIPRFYNQGKRNDFVRMERYSTASIDESRQQIIVKTAKEYLEKEVPVIIVDEQLQHGQQSQLQEYFGHHPVRTFSDFSAGKFAQVNLALKSLKAATYPMVIHTTKTGARGINFDLYKDAIVLCAFSPSNYADCVQALGRGCRNEQGRGEGVLIVDEEHTDISEATILDFL